MPGGVTWIAALSPVLSLPCLCRRRAADYDARFIVEARFYEKLPYKKIKCKLCPRECVIDDRERGYCGVRENRGGTYYSLVHSRVCAAHVDPIEKKPLFHFLPGTHGLFRGHRRLQRQLQDVPELGHFAVAPRAGDRNYLPPADLAALARQNQCPSIAYTYSEPVVFANTCSISADAGRAAGLKSVVISGGYVQEEPLKQLCRRVDAIKIDLKAFSEKFYKEIVNGELKPVSNTLVAIRKIGRLDRSRLPGDPHPERFRRRIPRPRPLGEVRSRPRRSSALLAIPSRVPAQESAHHAGPDARTRQSHLRRRRPALRIHRQRSRPSGRKHLVPEMPPRGDRARRLHRRSHASRKGQVPVLPTSHPRGLGRMSS